MSCVSKSIIVFYKLMVLLSVLSVIYELKTSKNIIHFHYKLIQITFYKGVFKNLLALKNLKE